MLSNLLVNFNASYSILVIVQIYLNNTYENTYLFLPMHFIYIKSYNIYHLFFVN